MGVGRAMAVALALAAFTVLAPRVASQSVVPPAVSLTMEPSGPPLAPLSAIVARNLTVDVACPPAAADAGQQRLVLTAEGPPWATLALTYSIVTVPTLPQCAPSARFVFGVKLLASLTESAPAFHEGVVTVHATLGEAPLVSEGETTTAIAPGYFSFIDVGVPAPNRDAPGGGSTSFEVNVANFGNGPTRVSFEEESVDSGWTLALPRESVIGSAQLGDTGTARQYVVTLAPPTWDGKGRLTGGAAFRVCGSYAGPERAASVDCLTERVSATLVPTGTDARVTPVPQPALAIAALVALACALARRARR